MNYTTPKLLRSKKKDGSYDWFVHYRFRHPDTGAWRSFKSRKGINYLKTDREKKSFGADEVQRLSNRLKGGWSPYPSPIEEIVYDKNKADFFWWFDEKIKHELARGDAGYYNWKNYTQVRKVLSKFKDNILLKEFNYKFVIDFEAHLLNQKKALNNIAFFMDRIKSVIKIIVKSGEIQYHQNPFNAYRAKTEAIESKRITLEDVKKLAKIKGLNESEELARDMYVFSFYVAGMRFGDVCRVKKEWFANGRIDYTMNKSKNDRSIKMMPEVKRIVKKYINTDGDYLFPTKVNWIEPSKSIDIRNSFYNPRLKHACRLAKIPEISFHTSRHSVADIAHKKGKGLKNIKDLLGHSKTATTEAYLSRFYKEKTDMDMDDIYK